jgi:hypothetical protein
LGPIAKHCRRKRSSRCTFALPQSQNAKFLPGKNISFILIFTNRGSFTLVTPCQCRFHSRPLASTIFIFVLVFTLSYPRQWLVIPHAAHRQRLFPYVHILRMKLAVVSLRFAEFDLQLMLVIRTSLSIDTRTILQRCALPIDPYRRVYRTNEASENENSFQLLLAITFENKHSLARPHIYLNFFSIRLCPFMIYVVAYQFI